MTNQTERLANALEAIGELADADHALSGESPEVRLGFAIGVARAVLFEHQQQPSAEAPPVPDGPESIGKIAREYREMLLMLNRLRGNTDTYELDRELEAFLDRITAA